MNDCKNFHGWIALPLETQAREMKIDTSADSIEGGEFIDLMLQILKNKGISNEEFEARCLPYKGKTALEIPKKLAFELYDEFRSLM